MYALLVISSLYISIVDITTHKVRNRTLIFTATVFAVTTFVGKGQIHLASSLAIFSIGLIAMFFGLGAGDVKLATATGLFVGHPDMLWVSVLILLAGGLLSITWAVFSGQLVQTLNNLSRGLTHVWRRRPYGQSAQRTTFPLSATRMPYALAIGAGTAVHVLKLSPFS